MRGGWAVFFAAGILLGAQSSFAAEVVQPDSVVRLTQTVPTHRLVETSRVEIPYGEAIGFLPAGKEREAQGPFFSKPSAVRVIKSSNAE